MNPIATLSYKEWSTAIIVAVLAITVAAVGTFFKTSAQRQGVDKAEQASERLIEKKRNSATPIEPVAITLVKTKKGPVQAGKKFDDPDNDWLRGFTLTAKNITERTITYIDVTYYFERPQDDANSDQPRLIDTLIFGAMGSKPNQPTLGPRESTNLVLSDAMYEVLQKGLAQTGYPSNVKHIKFYLAQVMFDDGTMWSLGYWYKRDPADPQNWINMQDQGNKVGAGKNAGGNDRLALRSHARAARSTESFSNLVKSTALQDPCQDPGFPSWNTCPGAASENCRRKVQYSQFSLSRHTHYSYNATGACKQCIVSGSSMDCDGAPHCEDVLFYGTTLVELCGPNTESGCEAEGGYWNPYYNECEFFEDEVGETACNDGIDNDGDGLIDCQEASCNHYGCLSGCSQYEWEVCMSLGGAGCWDGNCYTPILIDVAGNGFQLSNAPQGVVFNLIPDLPVKVAWTTANDDDAWLALDRNGNGTIDSGHELFGNVTAQPDPPAGVSKNGYLALAEYDKPANGGNSDGVINAKDAIFTSLRLWQDSNHNGFSESSELHTLPELAVAALELSYKESKKMDQYGNKFGYRAKVKDAKGNALGRWSWDVFLKMARP